MHITSYEDIDNSIEIAGDYYQSLFLDYVNNFVSLKGFAHYYNFTIGEAERVTRIGRQIHNHRHTQRN